MRVSENMYSCIFYASVKNIQCKKKIIVNVQIYFSDFENSN